MFGGKAREYPHLVSYLHHASQEPAIDWTASPKLLMAGLAGIGATLGGILSQQPSLTILAASFTAPVIGMFALNQRKVLTPEQQKAKEAREVAKIMRQCLELRRLHRDLDPASLQLIEECARCWARVKNVFESGFWSESNLPPAYQQARSQALKGADDGMQQVLLLYRTCLPSDVRSRPAMDFVEEALERVVFGGHAAASHLPAAFGPARQIADRLQAVAAEAEQIAGDASRERLSEGTGISGSLEATLSELRSIRMAEDELRQNLRG